MRLLIALLSVGLLANAVPTTLEQLSKRADLVVEATVTNLHAPTVLADGTTWVCFDARVTARLKGSSGESIKVCPSDVSEMNPPRPQLGGRYRMYLHGSRLGFYFAFSYAGFVPLP